MSEKNSKPDLEEAPKAVQLAVDLIQLLEENRIETETALQALEIVVNDFKRKQIANQ